MRLTKQTNYAIRMMMYCEANKGLTKVSTISRFYNLSESFLIKILQTLTTSGLIISTRGRNGGIQLARPAYQITIGEIVRVTEENFALAECFEPGETTCPLVNSCGLNQVWGEALNAFMDVLDSYTLADLTNKKHNLNVLVQLDVARNTPFNA